MSMLFSLFFALMITTLIVMLFAILFIRRSGRLIQQSARPCLVADAPATPEVEQLARKLRPYLHNIEIISTEPEIRQMAGEAAAHTYAALGTPRPREVAGDSPDLPRAA